MRPDVLELLRRPLVPNAVNAKQGTNGAESDDIQIYTPQSNTSYQIHDNKAQELQASASTPSYATVPDHVIHRAPMIYGSTSTNASNLVQSFHEQNIVRNSRTPITSPHRYFNSDAMANLCTRVEATHNISCFELKPELMVVEAAVHMRNVNNIPAQSTYAVWFAVGSEMNSSGMVPTEIPITNEATQVYTAALALRILRNHHQNNPRLLPAHISTIVIQLHNQYVRHAMDSEIGTWQRNGWVNVKNQPVSNAGLLKELLAECEHFEQNLGLEVKFWYAKGLRPGQGKVIAKRLVESIESGAVSNRNIPIGPRIGSQQDGSGDGGIKQNKPQRNKGRRPNHSWTTGVLGRQL